MVGVLVAVTAKTMLLLPPPGIRAFTEAMSRRLVLEERGERVMVWLEGLLAL